MLVALLALVSVPPPLASPWTARTEVVTFTPDQVSCADKPVALAGLVRPLSTVWTRYSPAVTEAPPFAFRFTFAIDAQGRARTIRRNAVVRASWNVDTSDLAPTLAASRFPAEAPRTGCSVRYVASTTPIETAAMSDLYELASRPETTGYAPALFQRVRPAGSNCSRSPGQYRRLNLPAFEKLPKPPTGSAWDFLSFDVDKTGKPENVTILATSGDTELDGAGMQALLANRYAPGPGYHGCTYHFFHNGSSDRSPPELPADTPADTGDQPGCRVDPTSISVLMDGSAYPRPFSRRRIEGVAVVGYDTAPWGAVGNVKLLLSEPDETFGEVARIAFSNARVTESDAGRRGCVQRVRFKLPPEQAPQ